MPIRLVIADRTSVHCELLADAVKRDPSIEVVGSVSAKSELLEICTRMVFDVALISLGAEDLGAAGAVLRELRHRSPTLRSILFLDTSRRELAIECLSAGARGIFPRNGSLEMLCKCVRRVYEGQIWATASELLSTLESLAAARDVRTIDIRKHDLLSKREREIVRAVADGLTNHEIGERLGVSKHTVKNHLLRVFEKLGVSNRVELLVLSLAQSNSVHALQAARQ
ncbi:MAG TPA: response regulator transcription factor [Candidatus Sulfotelmatobacter sp.]|nr:response regulator transcription factor [Candidatus Sulfotelmatobacter sp.]